MGHISSEINFVLPPAIVDAIAAHIPKRRQPGCKLLALEMGAFCAQRYLDGEFTADDVAAVMGGDPRTRASRLGDLTAAGLAEVLVPGAYRMPAINAKNYTRDSNKAWRAKKGLAPVAYFPLPSDGKSQGVYCKLTGRLLPETDTRGYQAEKAPLRGRSIEQRATAQLPAAAPLEPKEKKTNVCLSQANFQKPPPMPEGVAYAAADAFEATLPDEGLVPDPLPQPAEAPVADPAKSSPETPPELPAAAAAPTMAELQDQARAIGARMTADAARAPKVPRQPRPPNTPKNPYPKPRPPVVPKRPLQAFRPRQGASQLPPGLRREDLGPLNYREVEKGLGDLGVDPVPGTRDEAERMFSQLAMARVDLGQWRYGVHAVHLARQRGDVVANPVAYAWAAIREQQRQAENGGRPALDAPTRQRVPPLARQATPEAPPGEACLARALAMVGIKGIPRIPGAPP